MSDISFYDMSCSVGHPCYVLHAGGTERSVLPIQHFQGVNSAGLETKSWYILYSELHCKGIN